MSTTYTNEHITVHIYDMQPPSWVWTREARIAWLTCKPWRRNAQEATVGTYQYLAYRAYLLRQASQMFGHLTSCDEPTDKLPAIKSKRPITLPVGKGRGLLTIYNEDTVKVRAIR